MKTVNRRRFSAGPLSHEKIKIENPFSYPFYCIEKEVHCSKIINELAEDDVWLYVWSMINDDISIYFLKEKMHVFPILVNKGFKI